MEGMPFWLPIVFPIILFLITLLLILLLRHEDKKSRKLDLVKRYVVQHQAEMSQSVERFRAIAEAAEEAIAKKQEETTILVAQLVGQQQKIQDHLDDLEKLQKTLTDYHGVMDRLSTMTEQVEARTVQVKQEIEKVEQSQHLIDTFYEKSERISNSIEEKNTAFNEMVEQGKKDLSQALEQSVVEAKERFDNLLESAMNHTDLSFQTMIGTVQAFLGELNSRTEIIEDVVRRLTSTSSETMLSLSNAIDERRDDLESRAKVLDDLTSRRIEMEQQIAEMTTRTQDLITEQTEISQEIEREKAKLDDLRDQFETASVAIARTDEDNDDLSPPKKIWHDTDDELDNEAEYNEAYDEYIGRNEQFLPDEDDDTEELQAETLFNLDADGDLLDEYHEESLSDAEFDEDLEDQLEEYIFDDIDDEESEELDGNEDEITDDDVYEDTMFDEFETEDESHTEEHQKAQINDEHTPSDNIEDEQSEDIDESTVDEEDTEDKPEALKPIHKVPLIEKVESQEALEEGEEEIQLEESDESKK